MSTFLLYGAYGFVGQAAARQAVEAGLRPVLAGRNGAKLEQLASELGLAYRVFDLRDPQKIAGNLKDTAVVLNCAGPYIHTFNPMVTACLRTGTHYLDLTGEIPVFEAIAEQDAQARASGVMLLPGVGFDVVPTDCLALHLKQRLPAATHLTIAFQGEGPAGLPPGTQRTGIELLPYGDRIRRNGRLIPPEPGVKTRLVDFGKGPILATRLPWGDVFTAYYSTGIPNIENYAVVSGPVRNLLRIRDLLRPAFKLAVFRNLLKHLVLPGPSADQRARSSTHVWSEVEDDFGRKAAARLHGPEAGVDFTVRAALAAVRKVMAGNAPPGYQTPALAYGADFVLECEGVTREDIAA